MAPVHIDRGPSRVSQFNILHLCLIDHQPGHFRLYHSKPRIPMDLRRVRLLVRDLAARDVLPRSGDCVQPKGGPSKPV